MPEAIETQQSMSTIPPGRLGETDIQVTTLPTTIYILLTRHIDSSVDMPFRTSYNQLF